jgi:hypothetical protein
VLEALLSGLQVTVFCRIQTRLAIRPDARPAQRQRGLERGALTARASRSFSVKAAGAAKIGAATSARARKALVNCILNVYLVMVDNTLAA